MPILDLGWIYMTNNGPHIYIYIYINDNHGINNCINNSNIINNNNNGDSIKHSCLGLR